MRNNAALLWRHILTPASDAIFGTQASRLMSRYWADRLNKPRAIGYAAPSRSAESGYVDDPRSPSQFLFNRKP
jgi:hypothetical protein